MLTQTENEPLAPVEADPYTPIVRRVFRVDSVEWADQKQPYIVRYTGSLYSEDSESAYNQLSEALKPLDVTPLFRSEEHEQAVVLMRGTYKAKPTNWWLPAIFFILTVASVLYSYYAASRSLTEAVVFAATLLTILLCHEFGHYIVARIHHTAATPPYFIPFPPSPFGTMGAVIVQREAHKNKKILLDIGMAGPLAGFLIGLPLLLIGLYMSELNVLTPQPPGSGYVLEGNSIFYLLSKYAFFQRWLPEPASFNGLPPLLYWVRYFFTGKPLPIGGVDMTMSPMAYAAWAGLLVTALNLIPAGQLDGGHILNALIGKRARILLPVILVGLVLLGIAWNGWWLWALLIFFLGRVPAEPLDQITPLDTKRKLLALLCLVLFILLFTPVPLQFIMF
jgi:membrane-associated protease RseP (regulator of RpoE activity)